MICGENRLPAVGSLYAPNLHHGKATGGGLILMKDFTFYP